MNADLRMSVLDNEVAAVHWGTVLAPMLETALAAGPKWCGIETLAEELAAGMSKIVIVFNPDDGRVWSVLYLEGHQHKLCNVLRISYCASADLDDWIHLYPTLRAWASREGFDQIAFCGRPGWKRVLKKFAVQQYVQYTDDLDDLLEVPASV